jgi:hypothetical protein
MTRTGAGRTTGRGRIQEELTDTGAAPASKRNRILPREEPAGTPRAAPAPIPEAPFALLTIHDPCTGVQRTYRVPPDQLPSLEGATLIPGTDVFELAIERREPGSGVRSSLVSRVERWLRNSLGRMSDAEVLRAVEAQSPAETIAEILVAAPDARAASADDWAELLLRGAEAKRDIAELVGGLLTSSQAASVLNISVPGVKQRVERHKLLAMPLPGGQWGFPALQFGEDGHVRAGVAEVARAGAHVDPWALLSILVDDVEDRKGGMLLERLDERAVLDDVLNRLATYGEHVAG